MILQWVRHRYQYILIAQVFCLMWIASCEREGEDDGDSNRMNVSSRSQFMEWVPENLADGIDCPDGVCEWIHESPYTGRLVYTPDAEGDRIPDFSAAGYPGIFPETQNVIVLEPSPDYASPCVGGLDDSDRIQLALDEVAVNYPLDEYGVRGAVLLKAGTYNLSKPLQLGRNNTTTCDSHDDCASGNCLGEHCEVAHDGVVLRGEENGGVIQTTLNSCWQTASAMIIIDGSSSDALSEPWVQMTDKVVPVGANSFHVSDASSFQRGDTIKIARETNSAWLREIRMDMNKCLDANGRPEPGNPDLYLTAQLQSSDGSYIIDTGSRPALGSEPNGEPFIIEKVNPDCAPLAVGEQVRIKSPSRGYIRRRASYTIWRSTPDVYSIWTIESAYVPDGTLINSSTRIRLRSGNGKRLKRKSGGRLVVYSGGGGHADFNLVSLTRAYNPDEKDCDRTVGLDVDNDCKDEKNWSSRGGSNRGVKGDKGGVIWERRIIQVEGNRILVDAPLTNAVEQQYGGGYIKRVEYPNRVRNVGVFNLAGFSRLFLPRLNPPGTWVSGCYWCSTCTRCKDLNQNGDEINICDLKSTRHSHQLMRIGDADGVWVENVSMSCFQKHGITLGGGSRRVTVLKADYLQPESRVRTPPGAWRYSFVDSGQYNLFARAQSESGRHDFIENGPDYGGPNVYFSCDALPKLYYESGQHQHWGTGVLFDNVTASAFDSKFAGTRGTGHGWSGANNVFWNNTGNHVVVNPPTAQNWIVGGMDAGYSNTPYSGVPYSYYGFPEPWDEAPEPAYKAGVGTANTGSLYVSQLLDARSPTYHWGVSDGYWEDGAGWLEQISPVVNREIQTRDYLFGDLDKFHYDNPAVDDAYVDPTWGSGAWGFDRLDDNHAVAFTMLHQLEPDDRVIHGTLALSMRAMAARYDNDTIHVEGTPRVSFSSLGWLPFGSGIPEVRVLDLGEYLDVLNTGEINVRINDDTAVDFGLLTLSVLTPYEYALPGRVEIGQGIARIMSDVRAQNVVVGGSGRIYVTDGSLSVNQKLVMSNRTLRISDGHIKARDFVMPGGTIVVHQTSAQPSETAAIQVSRDAEVDYNIYIDLIIDETFSSGSSYKIMEWHGDGPDELSPVALICRHKQGDPASPGTSVGCGLSVRWIETEGRGVVEAFIY
ncbi:MAG: hypothetical protein GY854_22765 [Deltaproteobacteria bacterium]|nr:hypothetical protein [Deltaproteobacteria bacterium]